MKAKMKGYQYGGGFTMGAGDGDMSEAKAGMIAMAKWWQSIRCTNRSKDEKKKIKKMQTAGQVPPTRPFTGKDDPAYQKMMKEATKRQFLQMKIRKEKKSKKNDSIV